LSVAAQMHENARDSCYRRRGNLVTIFHPLIQSLGYQ
jgi:hypothetical protein